MRPRGSTGIRRSAFIEYLDTSVKTLEDVEKFLGIPVLAGLLGSVYLSLSPGGSDRIIPAGGEITVTQGAVNLVDLIGKAMFSSKGGLEEGGAGPDSGTTLDNPLAPPMPN